MRYQKEIIKYLNSFMKKKQNHTFIYTKYRKKLIIL